MIGSDIMHHDLPLLTIEDVDSATRLSPSYHEVHDRRRAPRRSPSRRCALNAPQELAKIIKSDKVANRDYLVVDVRDDDYAGGNIKSALNLPSREFQMGVYDLVQKTADVKTMIFHCALSQMRCVQLERGASLSSICSFGSMYQRASTLR